MREPRKAAVMRALNFKQMLNDWEIKFLEDLSKKSDHYIYSKDQAKIVNRITNKIYGLTPMKPKRR